MQTTTKTILVLGGSYAGLSVTHYVLRHVIDVLPSSQDYQVVLVSTSSEAMCRPACPRALISDDFFNQDKLFVSIPSVLGQYDASRVRFVHGTATKLDHHARTVLVDTKSNAGPETIKYHALVIATGASTKSPLLGFTQDEDYLRRSWASFRSALPSARHIVIAGGGPAGVETAGELGEYLNGRPGGFFGTRAASSPKVSITLFTSGSNLLPQLRPSIATTAERYLEQIGVRVVKGVRVSSVSWDDADAREEHLVQRATLKLSDGSVVESDLYIPATGTSPNTGFMAKELLDSDGRVNTNHETLRVDDAGPRVYAIGDVANCARPAVHLILEAVPVVCANLKRDLLLSAGKQDATVDKVYKEDKRETQLVPVGQAKGVGSAMGFRLPSWLVWLIKGRDYWLWTTGDLWSGKQWK